MRGRLKPPRLESLFVATFVLFGFRLGVRPIGDNSMLTHLRTGIDIAGPGRIPRTDPYSFTAHGADWVLQSWFPEWTYGWAHRLGGFRLVVLEQALLIAVLAWLVVRLARANSPLRTALAALIAVGMGSAFWSPRPLLFGLIAMALTITVVERRRSPWLLIPVVWLWVNSHGSFPLGLAWLGARAVGEALDWRAWPRDAFRYVGGFVAGLVVSTLNPLGARLLTFPFALGSRRSSFERVIEWMSPDFQHPPARFALIFIAVALVLAARARLTWRDVIPLAAFLVAGLLAMRNLPVAAVVVAPVMGRIMKRPDTSTKSAPAPGRETGGIRRNRINVAMAATLVVLFAAFAGSIRNREPLSLDPYPVEATNFLASEGLFGPDHRLASLDFVGNFIEFRYGNKKPVFIDDRVDMYPINVSRDYRRLLNGHPAWREILDRYRVELVLWDRDSPLTSILRSNDDWREIYGRGEWVIFRRNA